MKKLNKSIWSDSNIEQIVDEVSERVENPSQSEYQKFVGLEDFESGQFKIRKWGSTENLVSAMKLFKKGDLLFARRNAYLKRASEVDFNGVCSGDAIVLREKSKIEKGLLTYILNTDKFWEYAIANAAGTMSKRVKWRDLAKYKFLLPPPEEQKQIAALFQSIEMTMEQVDEQEKNLEALKKKLIDDFSLKKGESKNSWNKLNIAKWNEVSFGDYVEHIEVNETNQNKREAAKYVGVEQIETGKLKIQGWINEVMPTFFRTFKTGHILFAKRRAYQRKVAIADFDGICSPHIWALQSKNGLRQKLLPFIMLTDNFYEYANANSAGTMSVYLKWPQLSKYKFLLPPEEEQSKIILLFDQLELTIFQLIEQKNTLKNLKKKLLNEILG